MSWVDHIVAGHGGAAAYLVVFALVFVEDAIFVGFVVPGETAAVLGGVLASRGSVDLVLMIATTVAAAIAGDSVGYEVGRRFGSRLVTSRPLRAHQDRIARAQAVIRRRGAPAVLIGRITAFLRAVVPALAGMAHMPYPRFLAWNALGGLLWGTGAVLLGWLAGNSYAHVEHVAGRVTAIVAAAVVAVAIALWTVRRRRRERAG